MPQIRSFTPAEIEGLYRGKSADQLQRDADAVWRGVKAKDRLAQLVKSEDFQRKFKAKDPDAINTFRQLQNVLAAGEWAVDQHLAPDVNEAASRAVAIRESVQALAQDPEFMKRYNRGDHDAVKQYRDLTVNGLADALGVPLSDVVPAEPAAAEQPGSASIGSATPGGQAS